jgi:two-component system osmolarity sensor histidine kinase EnvZ
MTARETQKSKSQRTKLWGRIWRRNIPRSLWGRVLLIILVPIILMQIVVTWVFFQLHWETVTGKLSESLAGDIAWAVNAYDADPTPGTLQRIQAQTRDTMQLSVNVLHGKTLPTTPRPKSIYAVLDRTLNNALDDKLPDNAHFWFDTKSYPGHVEIRVEVPGGVMRIYAAKDRAFATTGYIFIFYLVGASAILTIIAVLFVRNQVRAIERLAQAAEKFGRGEDDPNFKPYGASEVRAAASAFIQMKERIQRQIEQRTTLLASVSHDLRTPLTRLKLELAMAEQDTATQRMKQDVSEMAYMIDEYLAFARGEMAEDAEVVSATALMTSIAGGIERSGHTPLVNYLDEDVSVRIRQLSIERALNNLIMNGFHYGKTVALSACVAGEDPAMLHLTVDDDGPGIAPDKREDAFKPFSRLDEARNQNIKGVGLGLAIARDIVRGHGGDLTLGDSPIGGLRAEITLPVV